MLEYIIMLIYLDNCCYNRPFDDQTQLKIQLESQAKLAIQAALRNGLYELAWSYILDYENSRNPYIEKREAISPWKQIAKIDIQQETEAILSYAERLRTRGIKTFDSLHIACAVAAGCDYFLSTDRKILNTPVPEVKIANPIQFIMEVAL